MILSESCQSGQDVGHNTIIDSYLVYNIHSKCSGCSQNLGIYTSKLVVL